MQRLAMQCEVEAFALLVGGDAQRRDEGGELQRRVGAESRKSLGRGNQIQPEADEVGRDPADRDDRRIDRPENPADHVVIPLQHRFIPVLRPEMR